jgi:hypothetical protein
MQNERKFLNFAFCIFDVDMKIFAACAKINAFVSQSNEDVFENRATGGKGLRQFPHRKRKLEIWGARRRDDAKNFYKFA